MTDRDAVRRAYDELAETYASERSPDAREAEMFEELLDRLDPGARLLDAGCGQGDPILARAAAETTAVGLDFSAEQLRLAAGNAPDAALVGGDLTALPFRGGAFDAVAALHSLIHVPLAEHGTVLAEFARVLRPGGYVLLSEGTSEWIGSTPDWLDSGVEMQWSIAGPDATKDGLRTGGFGVLDEWTATDELADEDAENSYFLARLDG